MLVICIVEAAFAQHERLGGIAEVQDLLHAVGHELPAGTAPVAVADIVAVVEALLRSMVGLGIGYRLRCLIC